MCMPTSKYDNDFSKLTGIWLDQLEISLTYLRRNTFYDKEQVLFLQRVKQMQSRNQKRNKNNIALSTY